MIALWNDPDWVALRAPGFFKVRPLGPVFMVDKESNSAEWCTPKTLVFGAGYDMRTMNLLLSAALPFQNIASDTRSNSRGVRELWKKDDKATYPSTAAALKYPGRGGEAAASARERPW